MNTKHPLVPGRRRESPSPGVVDTSAATITRRPRFTITEAVILNLLVNAGSDGVAIGTLREKVSPFAWAYPTRASIMQHIASIRAKIGEQSGHPTQIVSSYKADPLTGYPTVVGYTWADEPEAES